MRLWLPRVCLDQLIVEANRTAPSETGGVLIGYTNGDDVVVTRAIGPGPKATHSRYSFVPDYEHHEGEIAAAYRSSGRTLEYLGDWHTHPNGVDVLSTTDLKTLRRIGQYRPARMPSPVMLVLFGSDWRLATWRLQTRRGWAWTTKVRVCRIDTRVF